ncbi:MAG: ABC transporter ATP-binding protein [Lachnospiraceae bacterium]|nr:ABC transporter ATP-binding protein [Lachnospiraceae bacterium]
MCRLELVGLEKTYGSKKQEKRAVQSLTTSFTHGIYGLLGENGAGKTTLMRMIVGILKPTQGQITCDGIPIEQLGGAYRNLLGYLPQDFGYYKEFSAVRFLNYIAALKAIEPKAAKERMEQLLETVGLTEERNKKLKTFSGGMLRRIGIAQALLNEPRILILDEPTAGLDPRERVRFRNIISALGKDRIVILSTHIVSDVEYIADQIMIMKHGQLIQTGTPPQILEPVTGCVWNCVVPVKTAEELNAAYAVSNLRNYNKNDDGNDNKNGIGAYDTVDGGNHEEHVALRIVSKEKPHPDAVAAEPVLEDAYLYYYL